MAFVLFVMVGCQSNRPSPTAFYSASSEPIFPEINFYGMKPSASLIELCAQRSCRNDPRILESVFAGLQKAGVFQNISTRDDSEREYAVHAVVRSYSPGYTAGQLANAAVTGATMLLVPMVEQLEYRSEFVVTWRGVKVAEYSYVTPFDYKFSLYNTPAQQDALISEKIIAQFISDVQADNIFQSERIYSVLKAEDYHRDLRPPLQLGSYRHKDFWLFPDPRAGVQLRYENQQSSREIADVFVYPVRSLDWGDRAQVAAEEMNLALKDIDLAVKAGAYRSAQFEPPKALISGAGKQANKGWVSRGKMLWADGRMTTDFLYVYVEKDKYVKFRFSLADEKPDGLRQDAFVAGFMEQVVVPDESFFMASLRQKLRSSAIK